VRSTRVPIADPLFAPMIKSPSVGLKPARESRVWLRSPCVVCRLLGMSARLFGAPWLLIEICALVAGYGRVSGVPTGSIFTCNGILDG